MTRIKELTIYILLIAWFIVSASLFGIANRISYIHFYVFSDWSLYIQKLIQIQFTSYLVNLIFSLTKLVGFSLICIGIGLIVLRILRVPRL